MFNIVTKVPNAICIIVYEFRKYHV